MLSAEAIAHSCRLKLENVQRAWPHIMAALEEFGCGTSDDVLIAAAATIIVETGTFLPIHEYGGEDYLNRMYDTGKRAANLGNTPEADGDGALYCGRGFIQLTGHDNYKSAGEALGVDLLDDPDKAMDPELSARIFGWFFALRGIDHAAQSHNWILVRKRVNGGLNGYDRFMECVNLLTAHLEA